MKSNLLSVVCLALAVLALPTVASAGSQDFTLVNRTGVAISELYISSAKSDDWEEDVLGQDVLEDGASVDITFSPKEKAALWDLKIVDADGDEVTWENLKLNDISKLTLRYDKAGDPVADIE